MKKIAKLSLVAAIAVSGLTSANAAALEEAIKGVDISGTAAYRYDDRDQYAGDTNANSYKIAINLKSAINDDLTFNTRTIVGSDTTITGKANNSGMVSLDTSDSDENPGIKVSHANFAYTGIMNTTVIAGKQAIPSPFAVQADAAGGEDTGTGVTALVTAGPVTVATTYMNQTNLEAINGQDLAGLGLLGNAGPVALDGWYLEVLEGSAIDSGHQAYTVGATAKIEMVTLTSRYAAIAHDSSADTESLWKVGAKAKVGIVGFGVDYGQTNDVNVTTTGTSLENDGGADSDSSMIAWATNLDKKDDASMLKLNANVDIIPSVNFSLTYADLSIDGTTANDDVNEIYGQLTYKMGKNFMTYARFGQVDDESKTEEGTRGRLHVQYTF